MKYASGIRFFFIVITSGLALTCVASVILIDRSLALARETISLSLDAETELLENYLENTESDDYTFMRPYFDYVSTDSASSEIKNAMFSNFLLPSGNRVYVGRSTEDFGTINLYKNLIIAALAVTVLISFAAIVLFTDENVMKPLRIMGELTGAKPEPENLIENMKAIIKDLEEKKSELENMYSIEKTRVRNMTLRSGAVLQSLKAGIIDVDADANVIQCNQELFNIVGIEKRELNGKLRNSSLSPDITTIIFDCLERKKPERKRIDLNGRIIDVFVSPVLEAEQIIGAVAVFYDMTETVLLERMFMTREKMLSLSEISAGVSHEFRNSAGVLLALASAIYQKQNDENAKMLLEETKSLVGIVENFSQLAQKKDKSFAEFDVKEMTEEIKKYYKWNFKADFRHNLFVGDKDLIRRALINVLQNSIEASEPNQAEILVTTDKIDSWQRIEVTDKAGGIKDDQLEKVKAPFYTSKKEGVGLGLAIVEKIIQMHGGSLEIRNFEGGLKVTMTWSGDE
ncbi:GHKL domain-containing protein [candidate division WOR-3 bacterium]|nr:GHKL domain-containing protein [candidate division WOR-3 bacterium]